MTRLATTSRWLAPLPLMLLLTLTPAFAQGGGDAEAYESEADYNSGYLSDMMEDEGDVFDVVLVADGQGDGIVSERDVVALAEFTTWMYTTLLQTADPTITLGEGAEVRAATFWGYVWPALDMDTKGMVSQMDVFFPTIRIGYENANPREKATMEQGFIDIINAVWGDTAVPMASFLADEITFDDYVYYADAMTTYWQGMEDENGYVGDYGYGYGDGDDGGSSNDYGTDDSGFDATLHDAVSTHLGNFIEYN